FRRLKTSYGFSQVGPGEITTGVITSGNGRQTIELAQDRIKMSSGNKQQFIEILEDKVRINADVTFTNDSPALTQINTTIDQKVDNLEIGGENLLLNYNDLTEWDKEHNVIVNDNTVNITDTSNLGVYQNIDVELNTNYILSLYVEERTNNCYVGVGGNNTNSMWSGITGYHQMQLGWNELKFNSGNNNLARVYLKISRDTSANFKIKSVQLEKGNKRTAHKQSLKDVLKKAKQEVIQANETFVNSKNFVTQTTHKADLDGVRTEAEQKAIDEATKKMNLAKAYAVAQDELLKVQQKAYADKKISQSEQRAIDVAQAKSNVALENARAYADGKITEEERRAIADAKAKLNEAKAHAKELDDALEIGGSNLLKQSDRKINSSSYNLAEYYLTEKITEGEDCVLTLWGELGSDRSDFWAYNSGGYIWLATPKKIKDGVYQAKFQWRTEGDGFSESDTPFLRIYQATSSGTSSSRINKIQLEKGTKGTGWRLADDDLKEQIGYNLLQNPNFESFDNWDFTSYKKLQKNNEHAEYFGTAMSIWGKCSMSQPVELKAGKYRFSFYARNYRKNQTGRIYVRVGNKHKYFDLPKGDYQKIVFDFELESDTTDVAKIETIDKTDALIAHSYLGKKNYILSEVDMVAIKTDFLSTTRIEGNTVATGTLLVGNQNGANAGITGMGTAPTSVRMYAGATPQNMNSAPFRVLDNGMLYAMNAVIKGRIEASSGSFKGHIEASSGKIGGFGITHNYLKAGDWENSEGLSLSDSGMVFRNDNEGIFTAIGSAVLPPSAGGGGSLRLEIEKTKEDFSQTIGAMIYTHNINTKWDMCTNTALRLKATGSGTERDVALHIESGNVKVGNRIGYTGRVNGLEIENGIIVGTYTVPNYGSNF
ncbi:MAG: hypothetical protein KGV59_07630, partial [Tenacibaculum sp.]|nr:hypothetical protein [Tenacibaculum sp.]